MVLIIGSSILNYYLKLSVYFYFFSIPTTNEYIRGVVVLFNHFQNLFLIERQDYESFFFSGELLIWRLEKWNVPTTTRTNAITRKIGLYKSCELFACLEWISKKSFCTIFVCLLLGKRSLFLYRCKSSSSPAQPSCNLGLFHSHLLADHFTSSLSTSHPACKLNGSLSPFGSIL